MASVFRFGILELGTISLAKKKNKYFEFTELYKFERDNFCLSFHI